VGQGAEIIPKLTRGVEKDRYIVVGIRPSLAARTRAEKHYALDLSDSIEFIKSAAELDQHRIRYKR